MRNSLFAFTILMLSITQLAAQGKLKAEYYNGTNFDSYVGTGYVSELDIYWNQKPPIEGLEPDDCSVIYTGLLKPPKSGNISFHARFDDGLLIWINDTLVISNWQLNDVGLSDGSIYLEADSIYTLEVKYFNAMREAELELSWKLPVDPNRSWFKKLWYGDDPVIISSEYFVAPLIHKA